MTAAKMAGMSRKSSALMTRMARMDPRWCTYGFFKTISTKEGIKGRLPGFVREIPYGSRTIRISSTFRLGADDLLVLCALAAMAGLLHYTAQKRAAGERVSFNEGRLAGYAIIPKDVTSEQAQQLDLILQTKREGERGIEIANELTAKGKYFYQEVSMRSLVKEAGLSTAGSAFETVEACLDRLASVTLTELGQTGANERVRTRRIGDQLLAYQIREGQDKMQILLNPRLVEPIIGITSHYSAVDMNEMRELRHAASRILYVYLSSNVRQGQAEPFRIDDLAKLVHGGTGGELVDDIKATPSQLSQWRYRLKKSALSEIEQLPGWSVTVEADGQDVRIRRPPDQRRPAA